MKSINNLNTLNALIKDETMASKEYKMLAMQSGVPSNVKQTLLEMSADEYRHRNNLILIREQVKLNKLR